MSITVEPGSIIGLGISISAGGSSPPPGGGPTPTYAISPNITSVNEGGTVRFTVTTTNVTNGTTLYWTVETVEGRLLPDDFSDSSVDGSITINSGSAIIDRTLAEDVQTDGDEIFAVALRTSSIEGNIVATSDPVTVVDTSQTPF